MIKAATRVPVTRPYRYGVYGVGRIGRVHAAIVVDQGQRVVAVGDEAAGAIDVALAELGSDLPTFADAAVMADALRGEIDAAIVASHTKDHARHALPFIEAGIPVYLEKPLTDDLEESFAFVEAVGRDANLVQIGLQRRYDPALTYAKQLLGEGVIGAIREIRCVLRDQHPPPDTYSSRGLIIDMGIHVADEAIFLLDEFPSEVRATVHRTRAYRSPIDEGGDTAFVTFTTPTGVLGRLDVSRTHASGYNNETYIIGTSGTMHVGCFRGYPGPIPVEVWRDDGTRHAASKTFDMTDVKGTYPEFLPRFDHAYREAHRRFRDDLDQGRDFAVTQNDVLDAQVFVEGAHRSAANDGARYRLERADDIAEYRAACVRNGLLDG